jgi:hypothetical protein
VAVKNKTSSVRNVTTSNRGQLLLNALRNGRFSTKDRKALLARLREAVIPRGPKRSASASESKTASTKNVSKTAPVEKGISLKEALLPKKMKQKKGMTAYEIETVEAAKLELQPLVKPQPPVPTLAYGLERVLFNPGVYHLRDPRSRVFNFDPYLQTIMPVTEFDFKALKEYVTSSRDDTLISTAAEEGKKYTGSTSSMTSAISHFHYLLSQWRPLNLSHLSQAFPETLRTFTALQRSPSAVFLRWRDGTYAIDADKEFDSANILMMLGKSMEKLLTLPTEQFEKYRKENSSQITESERNEPESFHYTTMGDFLMRSQLDAYDPRIPGTGMFDLKTRAVISIRMDAKNYHNGLGYEIRSRHGEFESYEREYYDMMRSAFLKYSLQVRMGRMDGIFVAFHNTERIFGFQYVSLPEMDFALHGQDDTVLGDSEFKVSLELLNKVLDRATSRFPEQSLRLFFETRDANPPFMYIFAEPVTEDEIDQIQNSNKAEIEEYERSVLGIQPQRTAEEIREEERRMEWERLQAHVEESMDDDELDVSANGQSIDGHKSSAEARGSSQPQLLNSNPESARAAEISSSDDAAISTHNVATQGDEAESAASSERTKDGGETAASATQPEADVAKSETKGERQESKSTPLLAMTLTIRNKVNGSYVNRPNKLSPSDRWSVEYALAEVLDTEQAHSLYKKTQLRRARALKVDRDESTSKFQQAYAQKLQRLSLRGRQFREEQDELDQAEPYKTLSGSASEGGTKASSTA